MKNILYRHGDLLLYPVKELKGEEVKNNGQFILAEGETTGHKHLLVADRMTIKQDQNGYYISLEKPGTLTHEEHKTLEIQPGKYFVRKEREKDWFSQAVRKVQD